MGLFGGLLCWVRGHAPNRDRVWYDGVSYRTRCSRCERPMLRSQNRWVLFSARHYSMKREPHPRFDREQ